jgi:hypothetical protein
MTDYNAMADEDFRREVRTFVEREYPENLRYILRRAYWRDMKGWWKKLYDKGWIAPNWPREWGGMALDAGKMVTYLEEFERHGVARSPDQGITQVGPLIMRFGTQAQRTTTCPARSPANTSGARAIPSPTRAPTSRTCRPPRSPTAITSSSPARRSGLRSPTTRPTATSSCARTSRRRSSRASASCWWT